MKRIALTVVILIASMSPAWAKGPVVTGSRYAPVSVPFRCPPNAACAPLPKPSSPPPFHCPNNAACAPLTPSR
jgi:hypothetical protein